MTDATPTAAQTSLRSERRHLSPYNRDCVVSLALGSAAWTKPKRLAWAALVSAFLASDSRNFSTALESCT